MKTSIFILSFLFCALELTAQNSINEYKYVVIPAQYEFLGSKDKYQLNSLTKFLFNKYGFNAILNEDELPQDLKDNGCLGMYADLENLKGFLKTKVQFHLKDCNGRIISSSKVGETKEKMMDKAFQIALRDAFETFKNTDYEYQPNMASSNNTEEKLPVPDLVEEEIKKEHKETERLVKAINEEPNSTDLKDEINEEIENHEPPEVLVSVIPNIEMTDDKGDVTQTATKLLYAQPIENGFQIVDTEPKKVMVLYNSGIKDVYIVKGKDAVVYKKDGNWLYTEVGKMMKTETLNIKF